MFPSWPWKLKSTVATDRAVRCPGASGTWRHVAGRVCPDVSKYPIALTYKVKQSKSTPDPDHEATTTFQNVSNSYSATRR
jgi:hypothetical protein